MSDETPAPPVQSPPPMPQPAREPADPRQTLEQLSATLQKRPDRGALSHFLRLRRALRR